MKPFKAWVNLTIGALIGEVIGAYVFSHSVDLGDVFSASVFAGLTLYLVKNGMVKA